MKCWFNRSSRERMKQTVPGFLTVVILCWTVLAVVAGMSASIPVSSVHPFAADPVDLDRQMYAQEKTANRSSSNGSEFLIRIRREIHHQRHQCPVQPDPRSPHLQRRSLCPFEIQRDTNPQRIPDVILRSHCLCESSPCSSGQSQGQQSARCVSLVSPIKVAYLDQQLKYVVSTEIIHVPVACICAAQPAGRHMPLHRNIVVWNKKTNNNNNKNKQPE